MAQTFRFFASILLMTIIGVVGIVPPASAANITAGPMVGHVTESTAIIWVRTSQRITKEAIAVQAGKRIKGFWLNNNKIEFGGLIPNSPVHVTLRTKTEGNDWETNDLFFKTAEPPEYIGTLRIAFGSCSQDSRRPYVPVFEAMAFEQPDIALFVGDNSYFVVGEGDWSTSGPIGDWNTREQMLSRHLRTRTNPYLQRLIQTTPLYGIWDDHDYGPNNSDREFENKEIALEVFQYMWANPYFGTPETPGIFSKFRRGPADIFLMDDRYYKYVKNDKHPNVKPSEAEIWGKGQLKWLMDELKRSTAPVKIIANGTQLISKGGRGEGHFNEAPVELQTLLDFLKKNKIGGVVIPLLLAADAGNAVSHGAMRFAMQAGVFIFLLTMIGELLERYLFFAAVVAPKMPGGVSA